MDEAVRRLIGELRAHVADERVLEAIAAVPRERFVPEPERAHAWENRALGIGCAQTISQPLVVGRMAELLELRPTARVLDVGTGSGYAAAVLARLATHVWSIERHAELSAAAARALASAQVTGVTLVVDSGPLGMRMKCRVAAIPLGSRFSDVLVVRRVSLPPWLWLAEPIVRFRLRGTTRSFVQRLVAKSWASGQMEQEVEVAA